MFGKQFGKMRLVVKNCILEKHDKGTFVANDMQTKSYRTLRFILYNKVNENG